MNFLFTLFVTFAIFIENKVTNSEFNTKISKKDQVEQMFDSIAYRYDFINRFLSRGIDKRWRRKAISLLTNELPKQILDVACGTADFAIEAATRLNPNRITGIDLSNEMLKIGRKKVEEKKLSNTIYLEKGDSEKIAFDNNMFDAVTVAFGIRNFENINAGISEMYRVLKPSGSLVVLEFRLPRNILIKPVYHFYFRRILPFIGKLFSKNKTAYTYLPKSVYSFVDNYNIKNELLSVGFSTVQQYQLTFGIVEISKAQK